MKRNDFAGQVALVTGASSGLGAEFARQLHGMGADLIIVARRQTLLHELQAELEQKRANSVRTLTIDLVDGEQLAELIRMVMQERIDILINNAGKGCFNAFSESPELAQSEMIDLNMRAPTMLLHAVLPQMAQRRHGFVVNVASIAAFSPSPYLAVYSASKAYLLSLTISLRHELRDKGIRMTALCAGATETEFTAAAGVPRQAVEKVPHLSPRFVVGQCLDALQNNQARVTPGAMNRIVGWLQRALPATWSASVFGAFLGKFAGRTDKTA
jgi:short-subunit dehydrogenase